MNAGNTAVARVHVNAGKTAVARVHVNAGDTAVAQEPPNSVFSRRSRDLARIEGVLCGDYQLTCHPRFEHRSLELSTGGAGTLELAWWSWHVGAGMVELAQWSWHGGADAMLEAGATSELARWSWRSGAGRWAEEQLALASRVRSSAAVTTGRRRLQPSRADDGIVEATCAQVALGHQLFVEYAAKRVGDLEPCRPALPPRPRVRQD